MKLLQLRRQRIARTAVRIGENQQHPATTQFLQREFATPVQSRQAEVGRGRAGLQTVALDLAVSERAIAEPIGVARRHS